MELIVRTLSILTLLSKKPNGISVKEVSDELNISTSAVHRILSCLKEEGFTLQDSETKRYRIGFKVLTLAQNMTQKNALTQSAHKYLEEFSKEINKTVELCILENGSTVCIDYIQNTDTQYFFVRTGFAIPKYATSAGKAIEAYLPEEKVIKENQNSTFKKVTINTISNLDEYIEDLKKVKKLGYAKSNEELQLGVVGIACPIFDAMGYPVASVAFNKLKEIDEIDDQKMKALKECANKISRSLGYKGDINAK